MKLDPKQVRLIRPFWPTLFGRTLRFMGRRNTLHLQETAMVAEGEILLLPCLGLERLFGQALSGWSTITIPYSRIIAVRCRSKIVLRLVILAFLLALAAVGVKLPLTNPRDWTWLEAAADALVAVPMLTLGWLVWWRIRPTYMLSFRSKDGTRTRFHFAVRSKAAREQFDAALMQYRQASQTYARVGDAQ